MEMDQFANKFLIVAIFVDVIQFSQLVIEYSQEGPMMQINWNKQQQKYAITK